jgi:hypothetical protein
MRKMMKDSADERSDSDDNSVDEPNHPSSKVDVDETDETEIIKILRNDMDIEIRVVRKRKWYFNWAGELEKLWNFIKDCVEKENDCMRKAVKYAKNLKEVRNVYTCAPINDVSSRKTLK